MIKRDEVTKLAELARLELPAEELDKVGQDLSSILDYVSELKQASTAPAAVLGPINVWREDIPTPSSASREELLASAPESQDGYFKVKKILG